jgi:multidrug resistance efflux pump
MSRRSEALARLEADLSAARDEITAARIEVRDARASAEAAHAGVQALADMNPDWAVTPAVPAPPANPPARRRTASGKFAPESTEAAERLHKPGEDGAAGETP